MIQPMTAPVRTALVFLWPWALGFVVLTAGPMLASAVLSFTDARLDRGGLEVRFVGTDNYTRALGGAARDDASASSGAARASGAAGRDGAAGHPRDPRFPRALSNSLVYSLMAVPAGLVLSLGVALLLNRRVRGIGFARTAIFLPYLLGGVATILIWSWMLNPRFGIINRVLRGLYALLDPIVSAVGAGSTAAWETPGWLYSPLWCKPAAALIHVWTMGGSALVFLATLQRVPPQLREAALLDGAGAWQRLRHVIGPRIAPVFAFNLLFAFVFAMQAFSESYVLSNRAQGDGLLFYVAYLYEVAFEPPYDLGYACALAWIFFAVTALLVAAGLRLLRRHIHEAGGN
jgi:multiple sugar transport system permease protein